MGKEIIPSQNIKANQQQELYIKNVADGVYIINISNQKFTSTQKIIVKH